MQASLFVALPIAAWALMLLGYAFVRTRRDRIESRSFQERLAVGPDEIRDPIACLLFL
jgi:hypothetical protein